MQYGRFERFNFVTILICMEIGCNKFGYEEIETWGEVGKRLVIGRLAHRNAEWSHCILVFYPIGTIINTSSQIKESLSLWGAPLRVVEIRRRTKWS